MSYHLPTEEVIDTAVLSPLEDKIKKHHIRVIDYMATCPMLNLCLELLRMEGVQENLRWRKEQ